MGGVGCGVQQESALCWAADVICLFCLFNCLPLNSHNRLIYSENKGCCVHRTLCGCFLFVELDRYCHSQFALSMEQRWELNLVDMATVVAVVVVVVTVTVCIISYPWYRILSLYVNLYVASRSSALISSSEAVRERKRKPISASATWPKISAKHHISRPVWVRFSRLQFPLTCNTNFTYLKEKGKKLDGTCELALLHMTHLPPR